MLCCPVVSEVELALLGRGLVNDLEGTGVAESATVSVLPSRWVRTSAFFPSEVVFFTSDRMGASVEFRPAAMLCNVSEPSALLGPLD